MSEVDRAVRIANDVAAMARRLGADEVIVMVGMKDGEHSAYGVQFYGGCLPVRGLLEIGRENVLSRIKFPVIPTQDKKNHQLKT